MSSTTPQNLEAISEDLELETTTITYTEEIETVIAGLANEQKVLVGQSDAGHLWKFQYGSAEVFVQLTGDTEDDTLTVWSPVLQLPAKNEEALMRQLLEMNWLSTYESHFAINNNQVIVLSNRTLAGITPAEISRIITVVATIADNNDDDLQAEFGQ
ncbi:YbjN domain-containing protein [Capilliphycus salinus ALCB114379]|uniref:YbjN domain-containing protein n=1 Tax=Capilliphycus salinus TaxID=2768948 RepID=UPI0039A4DA8E